MTVAKSYGCSRTDAARMLGVEPESLRRWERRQETRVETSERRGRPPVIPAEVCWKIRRKYVEKLRVWGPAVLRWWCIREGHGDLRIEHIYLTEPWSVIDPLEFSRKLRFCDVAAEICFVAMELDEIGRADAAEYVIASYAELSGDDTLLEVVPFFKRYRAVVRGKVEWIRGTQVLGAERDAHFARSRRLFELALGYEM